MLIRFLDLIKDSSLYPCVMSEDKVVSLPPVTNSDITKVCIEDSMLITSILFYKNNGTKL